MDFVGFFLELKDKARMIVWLAIGLICYVLSMWVTNPLAQTALYKFGHVTTLAWIGYFIARQAIGRVDRTEQTYYATQSSVLLARSIIMGAAMIAGSLGL